MLHTRCNRNQRVRFTYEQFKDILETQSNSFEPKTYKDLLSYAMNYCIGRINVGEEPYSIELFYWYNVALDKGHIQENQYISSIRFKNIITLGLRQQAFEWVENFIENYTQFLDPSIQNNYYTFGSAQLHFYKKDFHAVLTYLRDVQYDDMMMSIRSKAMLLATYYELNEIVPLYALADSYRTYINRRTHKLSEKKREYSLNLIKFVLRLSKVSATNKKAITKLEHDLKNTERVYSSAWILEKIQEKKAGIELAA